MRRLERMKNTFLLERSTLHPLVQKGSIVEQRGQYRWVPEELTRLGGLNTESNSGQLSTKDLLEADPNGKSPQEAGSKLDHGKVDVVRGAFCYFPEALKAVAHVSWLGAQKYSWMGWRSVPDGINRYRAALGRHLLHDPMSTDNGPGGLGDDVLHAAQVAWNSLAALELIIAEKNSVQK